MRGPAKPPHVHFPIRSNLGSAGAMMLSTIGDFPHLQLTDCDEMRNCGVLFSSGTCEISLRRARCILLSNDGDMGHCIVMWHDARSEWIAGQCMRATRASLAANVRSPAARTPLIKDAQDIFDNFG